MLKLKEFIALVIPVWMCLLVVVGLEYRTPPTQETCEDILSETYHKEDIVMVRHKCFVRQGAIMKESPQL